MTRTSKTWLPPIPGVRNKAALLGLSALGAIGALALGPSAAHASAPSADSGAPAPAPAETMVANDPMLQINGYYCAPAATRIALSAQGFTPAQDGLAAALGTTTAGTNSINDVTRVLNNHVGARYHSTEIPGLDASQEQTDRLQTDIMISLNNGYPVVANIAGTIRDTAGAVHSYPGGHYLTVTGYTDQGRIVKVTDPADREGSNEYMVHTDHLADWIASRGYAS